MAADFMQTCNAVNCRSLLQSPHRQSAHRYATLASSLDQNGHLPARPLEIGFSERTRFGAEIAGENSAATSTSSALANT